MKWKALMCQPNIDDLGVILNDIYMSKTYKIDK